MTPTHNSNSQSLQGKRIMVTGAGGFIGSHLTESLLRAGACVGAVDFAEGKLLKIDRSGDYNFIACDLSCAETANKVIGAFAPDILFHLASPPDASESFQQIESSIQGNLALTVNTLEAFRQCDGELFIYGDSSKVYGDCEGPYRKSLPSKPISSYAIAKSAGWGFCELYSKVYGVQSVSVRPTMIYGPRQAFNLFSYVAESVLNGKTEIKLDGGDQTRDPVYIDDAIELYIEIARRGAALGGEIINMGGGRERSVKDLAQAAVDAMGGSARIVPVQNEARPTEMRRSWCDNAEAKEILGWQPRVELQEGLRRTIGDLIERHAPLAQVEA